MKKDLLKFRKEIDLIDKEIIDLISRRGTLAKQVGLTKDDGVIYRPEREAQAKKHKVKEHKEAQRSTKSKKGMRLSAANNVSVM